MKWRIERAGSPGHWIPGWIAHDPIEGIGASFGEWSEALDFVGRQIERRADAAQRAITKARGARVSSHRYPAPTRSDHTAPTPRPGITGGLPFGRAS